MLFSWKTNKYLIKFLLHLLSKCFVLFFIMWLFPSSHYPLPPSLPLSAWWSPFVDSIHVYEHISDNALSLSCDFPPLLMAFNFSRQPQQKDGPSIMLFLLFYCASWELCMFVWACECVGQSMWAASLSASILYLDGKTVHTKWNVWEWIDKVLYLYKCFHK